jgi:hypothetical protein
MKYIQAFLATIGFVVALALIHYIHIQFFSVNVVFYAAIQDGVMAALVSAGALYAFKRFALFNRFEKNALVVIWLLAAYSFAISIPTVIDRSLSFYILEKLQQRGGSIQQSRFAEVFIHEYLPEHRLVDVRLTEQLESKTIQIEQGCVSLTPRGEALASFSRYYRQHFLPKQRLLMGQYSDDLTNPFRNSNETPNYTCQPPQ